MKRILLALVLLLIASSSQAAGQFRDGNALLQYLKGCDETRNFPFDCGDATGYVAGVSDAHNNLQAHRGFDPVFCAPQGPSGVTLGQLKAVVRKYLENHPELLHWSASSLVLGALSEAFPCE